MDTLRDATSIYAIISVVMGVFHFQSMCFYGSPGFFQYFIFEIGARSSSSFFLFVVVLIGTCILVQDGNWREVSAIIGLCVLFILWVALYTPSFKDNSIPTVVAMIPFFICEVVFSSVHHT